MPAARRGAVCGDGTCSASEINNCPQDCGTVVTAATRVAAAAVAAARTSKRVCGDNICQSTENATTCPSDCTGGGSGSGIDSTAAISRLRVRACIVCQAGSTVCTGVDVSSCMACGIP